MHEPSQPGGEADPAGPAVELAAEPRRQQRAANQIVKEEAGKNMHRDIHRVVAARIAAVDPVIDGQRQRDHGPGRHFAFERLANVLVAGEAVVVEQECPVQRIEVGEQADERKQHDSPRRARAGSRAIGL